MCAFFVYVSPQTFAEVEAMGSSVPQLLEDPIVEPGRDSSVSNSASANTTNNPESVAHNIDLQVCLSLSLTLIYCPHYYSCLLHYRLLILKCWAKSTVYACKMNSATQQMCKS